MMPIEYWTVWKLGQTLLLAIMLGVASPAFAAVTYVWEDDLGVIYLAEDAATIPKRYRERVREITLSDTPSPHEDQTSAAPQPRSQTGTRTEDVDLQGHNRQWWRETVQEWRERKTAAEYDLERAQERFRRLWNDNSPLGDAREQVQRYEEDVREATRVLNEVLPEQARKAGAPPGWLRD